MDYEVLRHRLPIEPYMEVGLCRDRMLYIEIYWIWFARLEAFTRTPRTLATIVLRSERALVPQVGLRSDGCT